MLRRNRTIHFLRAGVRIAGPILFLAISITSCASGSSPSSAWLKSAVAKVGGEVISGEELDEAVEGALTSVDQKVYEIKRDKLEELVTQKLLSLEAKERGITVEELVNQHADPVSQQTLLMELSEKYELRFYLDPPRYEVSLEGSPKLGRDEAPIKMVEVTDFECPFCGSIQPTIQKLLERYPDQIQLIFKHFPLPFHQKARQAHIASLCAHAQGQFWLYRNRLFRDQRDLSRRALENQAKQLGLNVAEFSQCLDQGTYGERIDRDLEEAIQVGVSGTPTFFINGRRISGAQPLEVFERIIEEELATNA